jgi:hypothetical protein
MLLRRAGSGLAGKAGSVVKFRRVGGSNASVDLVRPLVLGLVIVESEYRAWDRVGRGQVRKGVK